MGTRETLMAQSDVLLVGSLPYESAEEAFRVAGTALRGHVGWLPDGEFGATPDVGGDDAGARVLSTTRTSRRPRPHRTARSRRRPRRVARAMAPGEELEGMWLFRVKPGRKIRFDDLKYGTFATESYQVFRRLRDEGVIPPGVRFQMSLPSPHSAIDGCFDDPDQWPDLYDAYVAGDPRRDPQGARDDPRRGPRDPVGHRPRVPRHVPGREAAGCASGRSSRAEEKFERHAAQLDELWQEIPDETLLGIHWCFGTWGGWPMADLADLDLCVRMSNEAKRRFGRRLDYVHMPVTAGARRRVLRAARTARDRRHEGVPRDGPPHRRDRGLPPPARPGAQLPRATSGSAASAATGASIADELPDVLRIHAEDAEALTDA